MTKYRLKMAFIIAPLFPALFFLIMPFFSGASYTGRYDILLILLFSLPVSYLSCFVFGWSLFKYLKKKQRLSVLSFVFYGALLGAVIFYIFGFGFSAFLDSSKSIAPSLKELLFGAFFGIIVAAPFSLIAGIPLINKQQSN